MAVTNLVTNPSFETASGVVEVRRNRLTNPSFEVDAAGWVSPQTLARDTTVAWVGGASGKVTHTADGDRSAHAAGAAAPGKFYTLSAYVRHDAAVNREIRIDYAFEDSAGALLGTYTAGTAVLVAGGAFSRASVLTVAAPAGTAFVRLYAVTRVMLAAEIMWVDGAMINEGKGLFPYFDGATAAAGDFTYAWLGTAHASVSVQRAPGVATVASGGSAVYQSSTAGVSSGSKSVAVRSDGTTTNSFALMGSNQSGIRHGMVAGETYTVLARVTTPVALTGTLFRERSIGVFILDGGVYANLISASGPVTGSADLSYTFTIPATATEVFIRLHNGSETAGDSVYWDNFAIVKGTWTGGYYDGDTPTVANARYAWTGTAHASTSTYIFRGITLANKVDAPCPRVGVTVEGLSPGDHVISVWRTTGGERVPVRGARSTPAVDSFYIEDFEAPLKRDMTYGLEILSGPDAGLQGLTAPAVLPSDRGYIQDPLNPASAVPVHGDKTVAGEAYFRSDTFASIAYTAGVSQFQVMGDPRPVSIGGTRRAPAGIPIGLSTRAAAENIRLRDLVREAVHLVIRPLPEWGDFMPASAVYAAAAVEEQPVDVAWGGSLTRWVTTGDVVRPSSSRVLIALWTYQRVAEIFATYDQKQAAAGSGTYLDDQKNPANV